MQDRGPSHWKICQIRTVSTKLQSRCFAWSHPKGTVTASVKSDGMMNKTCRGHPNWADWGPQLRVKQLWPEEILIGVSLATVSLPGQYTLLSLSRESNYCSGSMSITSLPVPRGGPGADVWQYFTLRRGTCSFKVIFKFCFIYRREWRQVSSFQKTIF